MINLDMAKNLYELSGAHSSQQDKTAKRSAVHVKILMQPIHLYEKYPRGGKNRALGVPS
jgi:hypothetical protein